MHRIGYMLPSINHLQLARLSPEDCFMVAMTQV